METGSVSRVVVILPEVDRKVSQLPLSFLILICQKSRISLRESPTGEENQSS